MARCPWNWPWPIHWSGCQQCPAAVSEPVTEVIHQYKKRHLTFQIRWSQDAPGQKKCGITWHIHAKGCVVVLQCVQCVYSLLWQTAGPQQRGTGAHRGGPPQVETARWGLGFAYGSASVQEQSSILNNGSGLLIEKGESKVRHFMMHFNNNFKHDSHIQCKEQHSVEVHTHKITQSISHRSAGLSN